MHNRRWLPCYLKFCHKIPLFPLHIERAIFSLQSKNTVMLVSTGILVINLRRPMVLSLFFILEKPTSISICFAFLIDAFSKTTPLGYLFLLFSTLNVEKISINISRNDHPKFDGSSKPIDQDTLKVKNRNRGWGVYR